MKNKNSSHTIFSQSNRNSKDDNHSHQLSLPLAFGRGLQKPQISSLPGAHPRERHRYRVMVGDGILGDRLTLDEALKLVRGGAK